MLGGTLQVSSQEFWRHTKSGGGWAANTLAALLLILICKMFPTGFRSLSLFSRFRSAAVSRCGNDLELKNPIVSPSIHSNPISEIISDLDLKSLIDNLDEKSHDPQKWENVIDRQNGSIAYSAKRCKPKDGPLKYFSVTTFENCSTEMLRDFYMDNKYRKKWDNTIIGIQQLQIDENNGTEIGCIVKKFPLLTAREYILAWRVWEAKDGTFYCFSKECEHPLCPRQKKYVRVELFRSGWRISKVPGRNACEIKMVHWEDAGLNVEMAKLAFAKGIWSYVCKMDNSLRKYSAADCSQSKLGATAVTLIQKVPVELDTMTSISEPTHTEVSSTIASGFQSEGRENKLSRRHSAALIANGLILLGGVICMSRGHSNLGAKVAVAYLLTKWTKRGRGASLSNSREGLV